jgi:hypothetical protein
VGTASPPDPEILCTAQGQQLNCSKVSIAGSRSRDGDKETQLEIAANKNEAKKQVDRNKLIAVFGRDDDLTKNKRDRDVSV